LRHSVFGSRGGKILLSLTAVVVFALVLVLAVVPRLEDEETTAAQATGTTTAASIPEAYDNLMDSVDDLKAARERVEQQLDADVPPFEQIVVDEEFLADLAASPDASPELRAYAWR
jgi:hypothetical protein